MPARNEEILITFLAERYRFANADADVIIGVARNCQSDEEFTIKGPAHGDDPQPKRAYRLFGHWSNYKNKRTGETERQFHFSSFVKATPLTRDAVVDYLTREGAGLNIGSGMARSLWDAFEGETCRTVREEPLVALAELKRKNKACRVTESQMQQFSDRLQKLSHLEQATIELNALLAGKGFPKITATTAIREWGNAAAGMIAKNPYLLMHFRGCGFRLTDKLYLELGHPPGRLKRQALCGWHAVATESDGSTWVPVDVASKGICRNIGGADLKLTKALQLAIRKGMLGRARTRGASGPLVADELLDDPQAKEGTALWIGEGRKTRNERRLAELVARKVAEPSNWGDIQSIKKGTDHQKGELTIATRGALAILGGSPGTGKTFILAQAIELLLALYGLDQVLVGAPTGKAAVRVTESLAANGLGMIRARTLHSILGIGKSEGEFAHNEFIPLPYKVLVIDEASMLDTDIACAVFRAVAVGTHVLLIGDVDQLPPVGHGAPLRDLIRAGLPYGQLTKIKRQDGSKPNAIIEACAAMRRREMFVAYPWAHSVDPERNLAIIPAGDPDRQIEALKRTLDSLHSEGFDPIRDVQVLAAVNAKSPLARKRLNALLQDELNPSGKQSGTIFRKKDKVVCTKNGRYKLVGDSLSVSHLAELGEVSDENEVYVANGEQGRVIDVQEKYLLVELESPKRLVVVPKGSSSGAAKDAASGSESGESGSGDDSESTGTGCNFDLAYALSVHKSQGSEWPVAIVMLDDHPGAKRVCCREWLYTAVSRAKKLCVLIGQEGTARQMVGRVAINKRRTLLKERINQLVAEAL